MILTKEKLAGLTLEQRTTLEKNLLSKRAAIAIPLHEGAKPLSPAQESIWVLDQLAAGSPLYNIPTAFRLIGPLNIPALERGLAALVQRHEALRLRFFLIDDQPRQAARPSVDFKLSFPKGGSVEQMLADEARKPFDLEHDILIRAGLIKIAAEEHVFFLTLHHIVSDNSSLEILFRELSELYSAFAQGRAPVLPPVRLAFSDLAAWQKMQVTEAKAQKPLRPVRPSFRGDWRAFSVSGDLTQRLKQRSGEHKVSLYMTCLAAFGVLLHRCAREEIAVIGSPIGQRDLPGATQLVGMLANTIPLRVDASGHPSFAELLPRVRQETLECHRHARALPRTSWQNVFQLVGASSSALRLEGITAQELPMRTGTSKFDLTFTLAQTEAGLAGNIEFSSDLFDASAIDRMAAHYVSLLEAIAENPEESIDRLQILPGDERSQVVDRWNQTTAPYPRDKTIHGLFSEQTARAPESIALRLGGESMTYRELEARSSQVAALLQKEGVMPGSFVGICLPRSFDLIAGLLGILKAGAAYLPLDAEYPAARLSCMLKDAGAPLVIVDDDSRSRIPDFIKTVSLRDLPVDSYIVEGRATDPAYLIYTSGSTGEPKGVVVPHRGVVRLVVENDYASFNGGEIFLQFAPVSFDASTFEIWGALLNGATLVLYPPRFESLEQFAGVLRDNKISTLWLTAGLFHQIVDHHLESLRGVKQLLAGGDVLSAPQVRKFLRSMPGRLINGYGPTENTTFTCCHEIPPSWDGAAVPIGRPIRQTQVYIVDDYMEPVPIGAPGELCIGGDGLALGYWRAPELTARKFVENPFGPGRLYRTGDLARWRADGLVEFIGRTDHQVKIRGFRVELGEVEQALARHPKVREAIVVAKGDALTAYVIAQTGQAVTPGDLREFLAAQLPLPFIPSSFVAMDKFPLTASGKVDRRHLPAPSEVATPAVNELPRNEKEEKMAGIWREALGLKQVGIHQNFFELGGHSLLAMRVLSRVNHVFGAEMLLRDIFEHPTIARLAENSIIGEGRAAAPAISRRRRASAV